MFTIDLKSGLRVSNMYIVLFCIVHTSLKAVEDAVSDDEDEYNCEDKVDYEMMCMMVSDDPGGCYETCELHVHEIITRE